MDTAVAVVAFADTDVAVAAAAADVALQFRQLLLLYQTAQALSESLCNQSQVSRYPLCSNAFHMVTSVCEPLTLRMLH